MNRRKGVNVDASLGHSSTFYLLSSSMNDKLLDKQVVLFLIGARHCYKSIRFTPRIDSGCLEVYIQKGYITEATLNRIWT